MRVLMVSDVYFPRINGVSTSVETFRRTLAALGHWAWVLLGTPGLRRALSMRREQDTITSRT